MKKILKNVVLSVFALGFFASNAFAASAPIIPSVTASNITQTSAVFNGVVNPNGADTNAWYEFQVANSGQLSFQNIGGGNSNVTLQPYTITGLTPGTTYKFRVVANNSFGYTFHSWVSFTTEANNPPQVCPQGMIGTPPNCTWPASQPSVNLTANPANIFQGQSSTLSWSVSNATSCIASGGWSGNKNANGGSQTVSPWTTTTYTLTCTGPGGSASDSTTVTVNQVQQNAPTVNLTANPASIPQGQNSVLSWTVQDATSCVASGGWSGSKNANGGSQTVSPWTTTTYTLTCTGPGGSASDSATVSVAQPQNPPVVTLTANPNSVAYNGSTMLTWTVQNATSCVANSNPSTSFTGNVNANGGSQTVSNLTSTTFFNIFCTGPGGSDSATVTVTVGQQPPAGNPPTVTIKAGDADLPYGDSTDIYWYPNNATSCVGTNGTNGWAGSKYHYSDSFFTGALYQTTTYTITCSNAYGSSTPASVTVYVAPQQNAQPTVDLTASQTNLSYGGSTNLNWNSYNANSCYANSGVNGWTGPKSINGSFSTGNLYNTTTYTITCTGNGGQATDSVTVYVENQQNQQPSVTTYFATNVSQNGATLNGYLETYGQSTQRWFEWGTSYGALYNSTNRQYQSGSGNFSEFISGLQPNTTYYFRAAANGNYGNIYGNVASFTTTGNVNSCGFGASCAPTAVTTIATNIDYNSARLNGLGLLNSGLVSTNGYFEWGTTTALGNITETKFIGSASSNPYFASLFGLQSNTTYYFRAVVQNQYGTSRGDIQTFRTGTFTTSTTTTTRNTNIIYRDVVPVTNVIGTVAGVGVSKPSLVYLTVNHNNEAVIRGSEVEYVFFYKNVSAEQLRDLVLQIVLPGEFRFVAASNGAYNAETRTLVVNIPTLMPQEEGSVAVRVAVDTTAEVGKTVAITGNLAYTVVSSGSQEEVFAYSRNVIDGGSVLGATALFTGFFPATLIGWVLLILAILLLVWIFRMLLAAFDRKERNTPAHSNEHYTH